MVVQRTSCTRSHAACPRSSRAAARGRTRAAAAASRPATSPWGPRQPAQTKSAPVFVSFRPRGLGSALVRRTHCTAQNAMFVSTVGVCRVSIGQSKTGYLLSGSGPAAHVKTRGPRRAGFGAVGGQNPGFMYLLGLTLDPRATQERNSRLPRENLTRRAHWGSQSVWIRVSAVFRVRINTDPSDIRGDLFSVSGAKEPWAEPSQPQPLPTPGDREGACAHVWRSSLGTREAVL